MRAMRTWVFTGYRLVEAGHGSLTDANSSPGGGLECKMRFACLILWAFAYKFTPSAKQLAEASLQDIWPAVGGLFSSLTPCGVR